MIETLGQSPINSAVTAGRSSFMSVLRNKPSKAFGDDPGRYPRAYVETRGILIDKRFVDGKVSPDLTQGHYFQFNPQIIEDVKNTLYEVRNYAGLPYVDHVWGGGGERIISFQLFLDNTPQSKQVHFRPTAYGSKLAAQFKTQGTGYTYDANTGKYSLGKRGFGKDFADEISSQLDSMKESLIPSKGPDKFEYENGDYFSISRVNERGILPEVEKIQAFLYPATLVGEETPLFAEGGVISVNQFRPPTTVVLALGPFYFEGVVKNAPVSYTLFDSDLTPIRGTIDIEFAVFEFEDMSLKKATKFW